MYSLKQIACSMDTYCKRTYVSLPGSRRQDFIDNWYEKQEALRIHQRKQNEIAASASYRAEQIQRDRDDREERRLENDDDLTDFKVDWSRVERAQKNAEREREALEIEAEIDEMQKESNEIIKNLGKGRAAVAKEAAINDEAVESAVTIIPFSRKIEANLDQQPTQEPHALLKDLPSASLIQEKDHFTPSPFITQNLIISLIFWSVVTAAFVSFYLSLVRRRRKTMQSRSRCGSEYGGGSSTMSESNYYARRERDRDGRSLGWLSRGGSPVTEPLPAYLIDDTKVVDLGREYQEEERVWHDRTSSLPNYLIDESTRV